MKNLFSLLIILILFSGCNLYLKARYNVFPDIAKKHQFTDRKLVFSDDFKTLDQWTVDDKEFYANNSTWLISDMVSLTPEGLKIICKRERQTNTNREGTRTTDFISGRIHTKGKFEQSYGTWIIEAKMVNSFCAGWLLKRDHNIPGYLRTQITPEIDILENIRGRIRHTVHWGYAEHPVYTKTSTGSSIATIDNQFHTYTVQLYPGGYRFYIDKILTAKFESGNPEFTSDFPSYLILNNAGNEYSEDYTEFIVRSVKVYQ